MNWDDLEVDRETLGVRARGTGFRQGEMARVLGAPLSTMTDWRPGGRTSGVPKTVQAHVITLRSLPASVLRRRVKLALAAEKSG